ncbi:unnamed protein product [Cunninghamella blakesleeana]
MFLQFLFERKMETQHSKTESFQSHSNRSKISAIETFPSCDNINWHDDKKTWSFQKDYVSFPSLELDDSQEDDTH